MGAFMIRDHTPEPVKSKDFSDQVQALRSQYTKIAKSFWWISGRRLKAITTDTIQEIKFHIFWYNDGSPEGQRIRVADIPGTFSGDILRLQECIPPLAGDFDIVGGDIHHLEEVTVRLLSENLSDEPEDTADLLASLPVVEDIALRTTIETKYRSQIAHHLRCQGGSCPGNPVSPYIAQLVGKTSGGRLVFERGLKEDLFRAFDRLEDYKRWTLHLISGVRTLHSLGIIVRNLSLANIRLRLKGKGNSDLVIFEISGQGGNDDAPETTPALVLDSDYTEKTDIYDIGEVMKCMVYGELPVTKVVERKVPYPLQGIVEACQHEVPELRPSLGTLQAMVEKILVIPSKEDGTASSDCYF